MQVDTITRSPAQKLFGLFDFSAQTANQSKPKSLMVRIETLAAQPPQAKFKALLDEIIPVISRQESLSERFTLLKCVFAVAEPEVRRLDAQIAAMPSALENQDMATVVLADNLLKAVVNSYAWIMAELSSQARDDARAKLKQQAAQQALMALLLRHVLAYRAAAKPSSSSWKQLHEIYRSAVRGNVQHGTPEEKAIELTYVKALLLAYANAHGFAPGNLDAVLAAIESFAPLAQVLDAAKFEHNRYSINAARFVVLANEHSPGRALSEVTEVALALGDLIIECRALVCAIDYCLNQKSENADSANSQTEDYRILMILRAALGGQTSRRFRALNSSAAEAALAI